MMEGKHALISWVAMLFLIHRGSYMSAYVSQRILHECSCIIEFIKRAGEKIRCKALSSILSVFPNKFNKFNNTGARMQDSIYYITLKSHFISEFCTK